jgi:hypothetical protein
MLEGALERKKAIAWVALALAPMYAFISSELARTAKTFSGPNGSPGSYAWKQQFPHSIDWKALFGPPFFAIPVWLVITLICIYVIRKDGKPK